MTNSLSQRNVSFDAIKSIAIILVIMIHTSAPGYVSFGGQWHAALFYEAFSRISVPLFFMVTGALLLPREHSIHSIAKRMQRVLIPLVAWSLIYLIFNKYYFGISTSGWLKHIIRGPILHLWFLYTLLGLYIFLPLFSRFYTSASLNEKLWILSAWSIGASIMPAFKGFFGFPLIGIDMLYLPIYAGYMLAGAVLHETLQKFVGKKAAISLATVVWLFGLLMTIFLSWWKSIADSKYSMIFMDYNSPTVLISTLGAFAIIYLLPLNRNQSIFSKVPSYIGKQTLGIYLFHMIPLNIIAALVRDNFLSINPWFYFSVVTFLTFITSAVIVSIIQRTPYIRAICP